MRSKHAWFLYTIHPAALEGREMFLVKGSSRIALIHSADSF
ncbi:hypothetical protein [Enterocloster clostridioformis]